MKSKIIGILIPISAVILGLIVGAVVMLVSGYDFIAGYAALANSIFNDLYNLGEIVRKATPLICAGLAVAFAFRSGLFNIGAEGQFIMGSIAAVWFGTSVDLPRLFHVPMMILVAMLAGAFWGFIPGILKATLKVHEVVVTIMMNFIALQTANYLIWNFAEARDRTADVLDSASLQAQWLRDLTGNSSIHGGIFIAFLFVVIVWFFMEKTKWGYELRTVGLNQDAAKYAGIGVKRNIVYALTISGALAGLAGALETIGGFGYMTIASGFSGVGFDGLAVALLGSNQPLGILFAAFLFAALKIGSTSYNFTLIAPTEVVEIVIGLIIFFMAIYQVIRLFLERIISRGSKK